MDATIDMEAQATATGSKGARIDLEMEIDTNELMQDILATLEKEGE